MSTQPLNPIAIELGPLTVYWYGVIIITGALLGLWIALRETERHGLERELFLDLILWALPIAIVSARLYYVIFNWGYYSQYPGQIFAIWEGGLAIHGALIGSLITAYVYTNKKGVSFWRIADIAAPSIILGQAIGRWGNFMNQEAHGGPVTREFLEGLRLPEFIINQMYIEGTYYHPTFLYESIWNIIGFVLLLFARKLNLRRGYLFLSYVIWYSVGRFFIEGMRTDSLMIGDLLRTAQFVSIVSIIIAVVLMVYLQKKVFPHTRYLDGEGAVKGGKKSKKKTSKTKRK
ncbi:prolipoprotein diacylglyceryl transferase [Anaerobacillus sp. MEB173]|uniref:prolipoprotein diacylglyceryl transferase n=1 Tax=Anaerobacillus sp. MEB173 TaxID=3383345 RepID=UPI003F922757